MKKIAVIFAFILTLLFAACGNNNNGNAVPPPPPPPPQGTQNGGDAPPGHEAQNTPETGNAQGPPSMGVSLHVPDVREGLAGIPIVWGYNPMAYGNDSYFGQQLDGSAPFEDMRRNRNIQHALSIWFDVRLEGVRTTHTHDISSLDPRPDIYLAHPLRALGAGRTIPEAMIRRYAPNYAALLDAHNGWGVSRASNGEQLALNTFDAYALDMDVFSVFRLEWLEEMDIRLPGNITRIADGVYFSDEPFSQGDFTWILDAFSRDIPNPINQSRVAKIWHSTTEALARERTWSMGIDPRENVYQAVAPILGMFGVNNSIMEEDGKAMPFFATQAYRAALLYLEDMAVRDATLLYGAPYPYYAFTCDFVRVGWTAVRSQDLMWVVEQAQSMDPDRRFLITPAAAGLMQSSSPFNTNNTAWVIGNHVSDDTLSRILNMFDEMSFSPPMVILTNLGYHSDSVFYEPEYSRGIIMHGRSGVTRISWDGEPYHSRVTVHRPPSADLREGVFATGIFDGVAWQRSYFGEFEAVSRFAASDAGTGLMLFPTREDAEGAFTAERMNLDSQYWETLMGDEGLVLHYLLYVLSGNTQASHTWDSYMEDLYANGLQEYIDLFSQFPAGKR